MNTFLIDKINKTVNLQFDYDVTLISRVKNCDRSARWNPELKCWIIPVNDWSKHKITSIIKEYSFKQRVEKVRKDIQVDYSTSDIDYAYIQGMCDSQGWTYTPRKYQLEALGYALQKGNIINGDDVGLGKTFEAIMYAEVTNSFPCLVVVPASVKYNWDEKWREITNQKRSVAVIESSKKDKNEWDKDVVVINYDIIGKKQGKGATVRFPELLSNDWKMVIFDEAHFLKQKTSQRAKAAKKIVEEVDKVQLLTGTATMNKPVELWNLLVLIDMDSKIANDWFQFITRYCGGYRGKFGWVTDGATNTLELNQRLRNTCYIRREKVDVLDEMPEVTKQVLKVPLSNRKTYTHAEEDLIDYLIKTKGEEAAEKAQEAEHLVALGTLRKLVIEGKLSSIEQYLKDWKTAENGKLLIFGLHREPLDYLSKKFKSMLIAGGVNAKQKQEIKDKWVSNDDTFLFANILSAGTGIDGFQDVCSNMLIIELPWRPSDLTQVIGRLWRSGQTEAVTVTFLLNTKSIDSQMWDMLAEKELVTEAVNKGIDVSRNESGMKNVLKKIMKLNKKKKKDGKTN